MEAGGLPASREVQSSPGTAISRSEYFYDDVNNRGNLTERKDWNSVNSSGVFQAITRPLIAGNSISTGHTYDSFGNRPWDRDARGHYTTYTYGNVGGQTNLYPTTIVVASDEKLYDYLPFGEDTVAGVTGRGSHYPAAASLTVPGNVNQRFTSKERDAETGLDYFGARYFSSPQGRFTSPDKPLLDQHIEDPQSWNLYAYGCNKPLVYIDPTGEAIKLLGDEEERKKALKLLQEGVGNNDAASRLYIDSVTEGDKTRFFVGITGDVGEFMKLSDTSHDLANIVENKNVVEFGITSQDLSNWGGAATFEPGKVGNENVRVLVNPDQMNIATSRLSPSTVLGYGKWEGQDQSPAWEVRPVTTDVATWHEFGHSWGFINGRTNFKLTNKEAIDWENRMREQLYGPFGPNNARRIQH